MSRAFPALPVEADDPDLLLKLVLIGDSGVGKSNLLGQFIRHSFNSESKTTIGVEFATKMLTVNGKLVKAQIWDTAGQERYRAITASYYKGAVGAMILYDVTSSITFQSVPKWLEELRDHTDLEVIVMLIGNKMDCEQARSVSSDEATNFARQERLLFMETSAKEATNVEDAFDRLVSEIVETHGTSALLDVRSMNAPRVHLGGVQIVAEKEEHCC
jgi:small GTP-binding protein